MNETIGFLGNQPVTLGAALAVAAVIILAIVLLAVAWARAAQRAAPDTASEMAEQIAEFARLQSELQGHVKSMALGISERLDGLGHRVGQSMSETTQATQSSLMQLNERLAVIDRAQKNITELSGQMVELQRVLGNKQTRGAFGQARMEAIVRDALPVGGYSFQATLSNRSRPDCIVALPNGAPGLVIDAKFPLEAWNAIRAASGPEALRTAQAQFRRDTLTHIKAIAEKYLIPGETQDTAFMFVPSESIFADIHEHFEDVVQQAHRSRVVIVSPSLLMLSIQVVQALLKDQRMREQAHIIRDQVVQLMQDVSRLDDRVRKLQIHFGQTGKDIEDILVSTRKITARGERIGAMEIEATEPPAPTQPRAVTRDPRQADLLAGE
jgi:DNA recombination protein RmuC